MRFSARKSICCSSLFQKASVMFFLRNFLPESLFVVLCSFRKLRWCSFCEIFCQKVYLLFFALSESFGDVLSEKFSARKSICCPLLFQKASVMFFLRNFLPESLFVVLCSFKKLQWYSFCEIFCQKVYVFYIEVDITKVDFLPNFCPLPSSKTIGNPGLANIHYDTGGSF